MSMTNPARSRSTELAARVVVALLLLVALVLVVAGGYFLGDTGGALLAAGVFVAWTLDKAGVL